MPVNVLLTFMIGSLLGWIVIVITKPPSQLRGLIISCCASGTNLDMILESFCLSLYRMFCL